MYKPNIFEHPITQKKSLQINLFEIINLNKVMRKCFIEDYQGKTWFWHRFVWRYPYCFDNLEFVYISLCIIFLFPKML